MKTLVWLGRSLRLLDQRTLPNEECYLECETVESVHDAIRNMVVRGAPAIGVAAAYGMVLAARSCPDDFSFHSELEKKGRYLAGARPTAINLEWAINRMLTRARGHQGDEKGDICALLEHEAGAIRDEDIYSNRRIGENLLSLLKPGDAILTHCNAGALATAAYGTALSPVYLALERHFPLKVFADETRPRLQGARLTAFELQRAGADITLIADNMAAVLMSQSKIQACIVGADRVAANGDVANKIGTLTVALIAKHFGIPFYVAAPSSSIDLKCASGEDIPIEERAADEIRKINNEYICPASVKVFNPAFDITPSALITAIVTEKNIIRPPFARDLEDIAN